MRNSPGGDYIREQFQSGGCKDISAASYGTLRAAFETAWRLEIPHSKWEASYAVPKTLEGVKFATTFKTRLGPIPFSVTLCPTKGQEG